MLLEELTLDVDADDLGFNTIYPKEIRELSSIQWSPVSIIREAAQYLAEVPGTRVLDIGSGVGKFCTIGASCTQGHFTGVELRPQLVEISSQIAERYSLNNVNFICANILDVPFDNYDAFYFFNSFYENIDRNAIIDSSVERGLNFYTLYTRYVCGQLEKKPVGTRLVTYWSQLHEVPGSYQLQFSADSDNLKFFTKIK